MSAAMVVGTMIGSGIYLLPTTLAPFGPNLVVAFLITIAGTMCLAVALAKLAARLPGGPFVYVRSAFGDTPAFVTMWSYIISQWTGVAAVAVAVAGAIGFVIPAAGSGIGLTIVALGTIFILTLINLTGARSAGWVQLAATLIKVIPLFAVVILVAIRFGTGQPVEALSPVPITVAGIAAAAALMLLPSALAANSSAPFADAIAPILGPGAGALVAIIAAISAFGTCNALLLLSAEVGRSLAGANDLPPLFRRANAAGAPTGSLLVGAGIASLLVLAASSESFVSVYVFIALVSTVASLVLYVMCAASALKLKVMGGLTVIAIIGLVYGIAMFVGAGLEATLWGFGLTLAGLPIRWLSRRFSSPPTSPAAASAQAALRE
jgi:APA family basic amino acid/polyamine antiporter